MKIIKTGMVFTLSTLVALASAPAVAEQWHHGNIREFHTHDFHQWRSGYWHHGVYDGRLGWWWVVAGAWYFYPRPIYPYPDPYTPPVVIVQQNTPPAVIQQNAPPAPPVQTPSAPPQYWYYCESAKSYYPYVPSCAEEWKRVPTTPSAPGGLQQGR